MSRRVSVGASILGLFLISGLTMALPLANAQSTVVVSIPSGAGSSASAAPGYSPDTITVVIGVNNTVMWTNNDTSGAGTSHTVIPTTQPAGGLMPLAGSGNISPGAVYTFTFTVPGTYDYHCSYHSWMTGVVIVKAASTVPEFPAAYLALTLFAAIAAVIVVAPRLRPMLSPGSASGTAKGRFVQTAT